MYAISLKFLTALALTLCAGIAIACLDTRPQWDDTGITAAALMSAAAAGSFAKVPPWMAAALVAGPILVAEISGGGGVLLAIPFALAGAHGGALIRATAKNR